MKLNELSADSMIQLEFKVGKEKLYLDANIAQVAKSGLVLYPVLFDGKAVSFKNNQNAVNLVFNRPEGKPLIWKNVSLSNAVIGGKQFVLVRSLENGQEYNRRSTYRLPLDIKGNIMGIGEGIVHDISTSGIAFYLEKDKKCTIGQTVNVGFSARNKNYIVNATVARIVEEEKRILYGCKMMSNPVIESFISEEQRIRIKGY